MDSNGRSERSTAVTPAWSTSARDGEGIFGRVGSRHSCSTSHICSPPRVCVLLTRSPATADSRLRLLVQEDLAAIATLVRDRGAVLATIAALVGGIGAFCGAIVNVIAYPGLAAAATAHVSQGAAAKVLVTAFNSEFGHIFIYIYFVSEYAAPLLMAIALWRSRNVPRWLAALFFVGLLVAELMESYGPIVILYMLPFAAAMVLLAARIWTTATSPQDRNRIPEPASVPV